MKEGKTSKEVGHAEKRFGMPVVPASIVKGAGQSDELQRDWGTVLGAGRWWPVQLEERTSGKLEVSWGIPECSYVKGGLQREHADIHGAQFLV